MSTALLRKVDESWIPVAHNVRAKNGFISFFHKQSSLGNVLKKCTGIVLVKWAFCTNCLAGIRVVAVPKSALVVCTISGN